MTLDTGQSLMRYSNNIVSLVAACFSLAGVAAHSAPKTLGDYKANFEKQTRSITDEYEATVQRASHAYMKSVDYTLNTAREKGDLDAVIAGKKEKKRFEEEENVPDESPVGLPEALARIQSGYHAFVGAATLRRDKKTEWLLKKYVATLERLKRKYVIKDKIDEALDVRGELQKAEFLLAEVSQRIPETESMPTPTSSKKAEPKQGWTVIFRSDNPELWDTDHKADEEGFGMRLEEVLDGIKFLRLRRTDTKECVIIEISKDELGIEGEDGEFGWNGSNKFFSGGGHLGVYSGRLPKTVETKYARGGWGFGHPYGENNRQMYAWAAEPIEKTAFEISVKKSALTAAEKEAVITE